MGFREWRRLGAALQPAASACASGAATPTPAAQTGNRAGNSSRASTFSSHMLKDVARCVRPRCLCADPTPCSVDSPGSGTVARRARGVRRGRGAASFSQGAAPRAAETAGAASLALVALFDSPTTHQPRGSPGATSYSSTARTIPGNAGGHLP
ncbi:hypothetical protein FA95DRAFT_831448 [Auriscalpium vulgare]|uniref:Uncharacterized protein n=1 Tax=Auriscalpium vulgare TaxID=40419 RepID=A0ACB8RAR1_9AGAM|nr:hypothetical protein FA95DRAFT_831448 [Auriscalpium vulgare]